jgi:hypothetical protein
LHLIISVDYEVFGNGKGDVKKHMVEPADRMMNIAERNNAKISFMAEVMEYMVYKKYQRKVRNDLGYYAHELIENQMRGAVSRGHDVELHIHPQFWKTEYRGKRVVPVDRNPLKMSYDEMYSMIKDGLEGMKDMVNRETYAMRLSNMPWQEAPENAAKAMEKLNIHVHSLALSTQNKEPYWKIGKNVFEIPIYAIPVKKKEYFSLRRLYALSKLYLHDRAGLSSLPDSKDRYISKFDISKLNYRQMVKHMDMAAERSEKDIPIVLIGHTKDFRNERDFDRFLKYASDRYVKCGKAKFSTFQDFVKEVILR